MTENPTLPIALFYARKGWRVFPCKERDKTPACRWRDEATTDENKIRGWWNNGSKYNIGMATGRVSGIIVLDVDAGHGGETSLINLQVEWGQLPPTVESQTGGGGRHIIFQHPGEEIHNSAGKLGPGLDIRGDGGYIVVPPSIHPCGRKYEWKGLPSSTPLAPMPEWLISKLREQASSPRSEISQEEQNKIPQGGRNQYLTSLGGTMQRRGMNREAIYNALLTENNAKCDPPLSEAEVKNIAQSVSRYTPASPPHVRNPQKIEPREPLDAYQGIAAFINLLDNLQGRNIPTFITALDDSIGGLERQTLTILAARPSMGKSSLAWQIVRNVALSGLKTYLFSLEMSITNLWARAACGAIGLRWRDIRSGLATPEQLEAVIIQAGEFAERFGKNILIDDGVNTSESIWNCIEKYRPDLVAIDHLRLIADQNESEVQRLGFMSKRLKDAAKAFNCAVLCLAQLNRAVEGREDKRPQLADLRESGHIEENADLVLMMYRDDYYTPTETASNLSETEILIRKFRDDVNNNRVKLTFDLRHQIFGRAHELTI